MLLGILLSLECLGEHILEVCGCLYIVEALEPAAEESFSIFGHIEQTGGFEQVGLLHGTGH